MGTNYYLHSDICPHCHKPTEVLHIGKSSAGWCFALHVYPDDQIKSFEDWLSWFSKPNSKIVNEYDDIVSIDYMIETITCRSWPLRNKETGWYEDNHAEPGSKGLARHRVDGRHCIGHGDGTYDLLVGDFS
jgi:hypothetical protein